MVVRERNATRAWQLAAMLLAVLAATGWFKVVWNPARAFAGVPGCEAFEGVWKWVDAERSGMWIVRDSYGVEYLRRRPGDG